MLQTVPSPWLIAWGQFLDPTRRPIEPTITLSVTSPYHSCVADVLVEWNRARIDDADLGSHSRRSRGGWCKGRGNGTDDTS